MPPFRPLLLLACAALLAAACHGAIDDSHARAWATPPRCRRAWSRSTASASAPEARARLEAWKRYAAERKRAPGAERELLLDVNRVLNRVPFVEDAVHWGEEDYWATPAESMASNGADCEDYTIAKYFLLKELGVPIARLRLTYVKS